MAKLRTTRPGHDLDTWRDSLVDAVLPGTRPTDDFWPRFDRAAPLHLRAAMGLASVVLGAPLCALGPEARDRWVQRSHKLPVASDLLEVAKVVACLAHFDDPDARAHARGER